MKVLVACEYSGVVRDSFLSKGHDAISCDLMDTDSPGPHYKGNVLDILDNGWDLMIAHPPCTYLCSTAARWLYDSRYPSRKKDQEESIEFFMKLYNSRIPKVCCENPVGVMSSVFRKPDQYVQPYQFGDPVSKKTGLWLKNLPTLKPTKIVVPNRVKSKTGREWDEWFLKSSALPVKERMKFRSKTFKGIAEAMADQWGAL